MYRAKEMLWLRFVCKFHEEVWTSGSDPYIELNLARRELSKVRDIDLGIRLQSGIFDCGQEVIRIINLNTLSTATDFENTCFLCASINEEGIIADIELVNLLA